LISNINEVFEKAQNEANSLIYLEIVLSVLRGILEGASENWLKWSSVDVWYQSDMFVKQMTKVIDNVSNWQQNAFKTDNYEFS